jgi:protein involved in polysaccharide export with SLBB domain
LDGDILFVPSKSSLVEIDGAVFQPTQAIYKTGKKFLDYIETAGGFKRRADKRRAYVEYANGEISRVRSFLFFKSYPEINTDAIIKVPIKPESQRINFDRLISLITTTISTYLLIEAVSNR